MSRKSHDTFGMFAVAVCIAVILVAATFGIIFPAPAADSGQDNPYP